MDANKIVPDTTNKNTIIDIPEYKTSQDANESLGVTYKSSTPITNSELQQDIEQRQEFRQYVQQEYAGLLASNLDKTSTQATNLATNKANDYAKNFSKLSGLNEKESKHLILKDLLYVRDSIRPEYDQTKNLSNIFESSLNGDQSLVAKVYNYTPVGLLTGGIPTERELYLRLHNFASPMVRSLVEAIPGTYGETSKAFGQAAEAYTKEKIPTLSISNIKNVLLPQAIRMAGEFAIARKLTGVAGLDFKASSTLYNNRPFLFSALQSGTTMATHNVVFNPDAYQSPSSFVVSTAQSGITGAALGWWNKVLGGRTMYRILDNMVMTPTLFGGIAAAESAIGGEDKEGIRKAALEGALSTVVFNSVNGIQGMIEQREAWKKQKDVIVKDGVKTLMGALAAKKGDDGNWYYDKKVVRSSATNKLSLNQMAKEYELLMQSATNAVNKKQYFILEKVVKALEKKEAAGNIRQSELLTLNTLRANLPKIASANETEALDIAKKTFKQRVSKVDEFRMREKGINTNDEKTKAFTATNDEVNQHISLLKKAGVSDTHINTNKIKEDIFAKKATSFYQELSDDIVHVLGIPVAKPVKVKVVIPNGSSQPIADIDAIKENTGKYFNIRIFLDPSKHINMSLNKDSSYSSWNKHVETLLKDPQYTAKGIEGSSFYPKSKNPIDASKNAYFVKNHSEGLGKDIIIINRSGSSTIKNILTHELTHAIPEQVDAAQSHGDSFGVSAKKYMASLIGTVGREVQKGQSTLMSFVSAREAAMRDIKKMAKDAGLDELSKVDISAMKLKDLYDFREEVNKQYTKYNNERFSSIVGLNNEERNILKKGVRNDIIATSRAMDRFADFLGNNKMPTDTIENKDIRRDILGRMIASANAQTRDLNSKMTGKKIDLSTLYTSMRYWIQDLGERTGRSSISQRYDEAIASVGQAAKTASKVLQDMTSRTGMDVNKLEALNANESARIASYLHNPTDEVWSIMAPHEKKIVESIRETLQKDTPKFVRGVRFYLWMSENASAVKKLTNAEQKATELAVNMASDLKERIAKDPTTKDISHANTSKITKLETAIEKYKKQLENTAPENWNNEKDKHKDIIEFLKTHIKAMELGEEPFLKFLEGKNWGTREDYYMSAKNKELLETFVSNKFDFSAIKKTSNINYTDVIQSFAKPRKFATTPDMLMNPILATVRHVDTIARSFYLFPRLQQMYSELSGTPLAEHEVRIMNRWFKNLTGRYEAQDPVTKLASMVGSIGWKNYFRKPSNVLWFSARQIGNVALMTAQVSPFELAMASKRMIENKKTTGDYLHPETREMGEKVFSTVVEQGKSAYSSLTLEDASRAAIRGDIAARLNPLLFKLTRMGQYIVPKIDTLARMPWFPIYEMSRHNLQEYKNGNITWNKLLSRLDIRTLTEPQRRDLLKKFNDVDLKGFSSTYATAKIDNTNAIYNSLGRTPAEQFAAGVAALGLSTFQRSVYEMYYRNGVLPMLKGLTNGDYRTAYDGLKGIIKTASVLVLTQQAMKNTIGFRGKFADFGPVSSALALSPMSLGTSVIGNTLAGLEQIMSIAASDDDQSTKIEKILKISSNLGELFVPMSDVMISMSANANDKSNVRLFNILKQITMSRYKMKNDDKLEYYKRTSMEKFLNLTVGTKGSKPKEKE